MRREVVGIVVWVRDDQANGLAQDPSRTPIIELDNVRITRN